jgi:hypothetical protein
LPIERLRIVKGAGTQGHSAGHFSLGGRAGLCYRNFAELDRAFGIIVFGFRDGVPHCPRDNTRATAHLPPEHLPKYVAAMRQYFASRMFSTTRKMF